MLLKSKHVLAAFALTPGFAAVGCTEDPKPAEEVVKADTTPPPPAAEPVKPVETFTAQTVYFAFDDYSLNSDAQSKLSGLADHLKAAQKTVVQVEGHCDERGSTEYNLALGERRAQAVKKYLGELGVDAARVAPVSYGEEKPAVEGHDEAAWAKNRRAEFTLSTPN